MRKYRGRLDIGGDNMKNLANMMTSLRIAAAFLIPWASPLSTPFWICYLCGGLSDLLDGMIARAMKQQSEFGAELDGAADLLFTASLFFVVIKNELFPLWLLGGAAVVLMIRAASYAIGYCKYHAFASLHTYMNKAAGFVLFLYPVLYAIWGMNLAGVLIFTIALISSAEELFITVRAKELNRNCKSALCRRRTG